MNETEKITINLSVVDLGQIDLLVEEGLYTNRTDFIRAGIRLQLHQHSEVVKQAVVRKSLVIGVLIFDRKQLEAHRSRNQKLAIRAIGLVSLSNDITPDLARDVIESVKVNGILRASHEVRSAIADRIM
ncbi:MAG: CopG family transcriptional regulator [Planctomycetes bacterium]|nr:CopG family transcriptional regulator [Planctomycetota bacterium]